MRYVKKFEQFDYQHINEEEEIFKKIKEWWTSKKTELGKKMMENIKKNPEAVAKLEEAKKAFAKLPTEDKKRIEEVSRGENAPDPKSDPGGKVEEAVGDVVGKIVKWFGLTVAAVSFIGLLIAVIKLAIVGTGFVAVLGGLCTLGNLVGILMASTFGGGLIAGAAGIATEKD